MSGRHMEGLTVLPAWNQSFDGRCTRRGTIAVGSVPSPRMRLRPRRPRDASVPARTREDLLAVDAADVRRYEAALGLHDGSRLAARRYGDGGDDRSARYAP